MDAEYSTRRHFHLAEGTVQEGGFAFAKASPRMEKLQLEKEVIKRLVVCVALEIIRKWRTYEKFGQLD